MRLALLDPPRGQKLRERVVGFEPRRGDGDLEHRDQMPPTRRYFDSRRHDRLAPVRDHDDITGLDVRRRVFEEAEVVAVVSCGR